MDSVGAGVGGHTDSFRVSRELHREGSELVTQTMAPGAVLSEAAAALYAKVGFKATGPEQAAILACRKRFVGVSGGEGAGKSMVVSAMWLGRWPDDMAMNPGVGDGTGPPLIYWLVGEDYSQVTEEFRYIKSF